MKRPSVLAILPFRDLDPSLLKRAAQPVLSATDAARDIKGDRLSAFFAGRAALATAFQYAGLEAAIEADAEHGYLRVVSRDGKPMKGLYANLTHGGSLAVAALAPFPVGVDAEGLERDVDKVAEKFLAPDERGPATAKFRLGSSDVPGALAFWCAKEAYAKGVGRGIAVGLTEVKVALAGSPPYRVSSAPRGPLPLVTPAVAFEVHSKHLIAICTEREALETGFHRLTVKLGG